MQDVKAITSSYRAKRLRGRIVGDFRNVMFIMSVVQLSYLPTNRNSRFYEESYAIKKSS